VALPNIDPDRAAAPVERADNSVSLARTEPALYIIEDAHWIDEVSESMFADFLTVIPQTHSTVLITTPRITKERSRGYTCADDFAGTAY